MPNTLVGCGRRLLRLTRNRLASGIGPANISVPVKCIVPVDIAGYRDQPVPEQAATASQPGQTGRLRVPQSRQLGTPDTIPLHPQTAGCNPDFMLIARSKSKSRFGCHDASRNQQGAAAGASRESSIFAPEGWSVRHLPLSSPGPTQSMAWIRRRRRICNSVRCGRSPKVSGRLHRSGADCA